MTTERENESHDDRHDDDRLRGEIDVSEAPEPRRRRFVSKKEFLALKRGDRRRKRESRGRRTRGTSFRTFPSCQGAFSRNKDGLIKILKEQHHVRTVNVIDPDDGDLTIIITGGAAGYGAVWDPDRNRSLPVWETDFRTALVVCYEIVEKALPGWRNGIIKNIERRTHPELHIVELEHGTPLAIMRLLEGAHYTRDDPYTIPYLYDPPNLRELGDLARLCHKYDALHLIGSNLARWIDGLGHFIPWNPMNPEEEPAPETVLDCLWAAYEFGMEGIFRQICFSLIYVANSVFTNPASLPPGVLDEIHKARKAFIDVRVAPIASYRRYLRTAIYHPRLLAHLCCSPTGQEECLLWQRHAIDNYLRLESLDLEGDMLEYSADTSPVDLFPNLDELSIATPHGHDGGEQEQEECGGAKLKRWLSTNGKDVLMDWLAVGKGWKPSAEHLAYMEKQRAKIRPFYSDAPDFPDFL